MAKSRQVIVGLDVLRFAAAFMVMCGHFCAAWAVPASLPAQIMGRTVTFPALFHVTWFGWLGVEIFFVVSGIVITYSANGISAFAFLRSRFLRLYPAVWVCASISAPVAVVLGLETYRRIVHGWAASIVLFPFPPYADPSYWTLGIEMVFYAAVFLLLLTNRFKHLEGFAVMLGCMSAGYWIFGTAFAHGFIERHLWDRRFELTTIPYGCFFALGMMIYIVSRQGLSLSRIAAMIACTAAGLIEVGYKTAHYSKEFNAKEPAILPQTLFLAVLAFVLISMRVRLSRSNPKAEIIRRLGLTTYPLYLVHQILGTALIRFAVVHGVSDTVALLFAVACCVSLSLLIAITIEPPVQSVLHKAFGRMEVAAKARGRWKTLFRQTAPVAGNEIVA